MRPFFSSNVRRQDDVVTDPDISDACYDSCNNAAYEAQKHGKDPALCDQDSTFGTFLNECTDCVKETTKSGNASDDLIPAGFDQFIDYCASQGNGTDQIDAVAVNTLLASYSSLVASQSALEDALSSRGYNLSTTTDTPTTTTRETRPTLTASQTAVSGTDGSDADSPNTKVIVPAVVVPVVCLIAAAAVIWALIRRRRRRQMLQNNGDTDGFDGKAQLHADEFRPELEAVTIAKEKSTDPDENSVVAELPAREPVGSEMDATNQTEERRASS